MAIPPMHPSRKTRSLEYYLNIVKMPCDRAAAAMAARSAAAQLSRSSTISIIFPLAFAVVFILILSQTMIPGSFGLFMLVFLLVFVLAIGSMLWSSARMSGAAEDLEGLAYAIESGLLSREEYCDKTLYQALMTYKAKRGPISKPR